MIFVSVIFIVILLVAIIFLSRKTSLSLGRTREQFSKELVHHLGGKLEPLDGQDSSYRLSFNFEGYNFVFEDLELKGFENKIDKAYLKLKLNNKFTLVFSEIERSSGFRNESTASSKDDSDSLTTMMKVYVPKGLGDMQVRTNDPSLANKLFEDSKILAMLIEFKNVDSRGYPSLGLRIVDGVIILEFSSAAGYSPNLRSLHISLGSIENYIDKLQLLAKKLAKHGYL